MILGWRGFSSIPRCHPLHARDTRSREDHGRPQTLQMWGSKVERTGTPGGQPGILIEQVWDGAHEGPFLKEFRLCLVSREAHY